MTNCRFLFLLGLSFITFVHPATSQILFSSGSPYTQDFDSLANSGTANAWTDNLTIQGWYAWKTNTGTPSSVSAYQASTGTTTAGSLYSFGVAGVNAVTDRALGSLASGNAAAGGFAYGVRFTNNTALAISNITITYTGEQWRNGGNTSTQTLAFSYRISNAAITDTDPMNVNTWTPFTSLDFKTPNVGTTASALDGNDPANRHLFSGVLVSGAVVLPGQEVLFRWSDVNDPGNDHGVSLDDLSISFTSVTPVTNPPAITAQPQSRTNQAGTLATFTVTATGTTPDYRWRKDGNPLVDAFNIFGSGTPTLYVSNVLASDVGNYTVVITNSVGSVTSAIASLTVLDPAFHLNPQSRTNVAGDTANFFITAGGTPVLSYQWRFNGNNIQDATDTSLNVTNVQSATQGVYTVVVTGGNGSATSSPANLYLLATPATRLARWDFNATNSLSPSTPVSSEGSGSASLVGGTTGAFASGSFSDPAGVPSSANSGWNTSTYPGQGTSNKLGGVQFNVSTVGGGNILLSWEERHSDTASKYMRLQYSTDGSTFTDGPVITMNATDNSYVFYYADLSGIQALNNNPNFAFRIVSEWESTAINTANNNYDATVSSYNTGGTVRFDLVSVYANLKPTLGIQQLADKVVLSWTDPSFFLYAAPAVTGTYGKIIGATSPYTNSSPANQRYFRLQSN